MKNISVKLNNFQKIYASELADVIFFIAAIEIFALVLLFGGAR